ncbi:MAG: acetylxylan esterase [Bryobacteraceae bacterium]|nr:acetylxylan esterase [Bryobacteraceae bacterium]
MRRIALLAAAAAALLTGQDVRNTSTPNTDTHVVMPEYKTLAQWEARKAALRKQILFAAGLWPMPAKNELRPLLSGRLERDGYTIEKVAIETLPGYWLAGNLFSPRGKQGPFPAIVRPHGHWTYGRLEHQPLNSIPTHAANLAREGFVVFAYDMVGFTDTVQTPHNFAKKPEQLWAFGPLGLQLWNSIRVVDYLASLPSVDRNRIGVTGASGGGTQAFLLAAVDDRLAFAAPVNMVSAYMQGGSPCENAPGLRVGTSNLEFAAMFAPKPMLLVSATGDWTKQVPREEFPAIRKVYELYGKPENVQVVQFDAPHNYNKDSREAVTNFLRKTAYGRTDTIRERGVAIEKLADMMVWHGRALPEGAKHYEQIFGWWRQMSREQTDAAAPDRLREGLRLALGSEWPAEVKLEGTAMTRPGRGDRVPATFTAGKGVPIVAIGAAQVFASGRPVLRIEPFQTGSAAAPRDRSHTHFLTFNASDDAARVQDIVTAIRFVAGPEVDEVEISADGPARIWALFAAAVSPVKVRLTAPPFKFAGTDDDYIEQFFVPGIQRAGGFEAAMKAWRGR